MRAARKKAENPSKKDRQVTVGGVNIFKPLRRTDANEAFAKIGLAYRIHVLIERSGLTQTQAGKLLGTDRARISNLMRGQLKEFSIERLFHFLNSLDQDIDVMIRPKRRAHARVQILAKAS
jgi:predicted XRE-type DNA-binding protein